MLQPAEAGKPTGSHTDPEPLVSLSRLSHVCPFLLLLLLHKMMGVKGVIPQSSY